MWERTGRESVRGRRVDEGGGSCSCVSARERCTILTAARVMPCSNPRIKTSSDSLRQITDIFPLSPPGPSLNDDQSMPLPFVMCREKALLLFFHQYLLSYQYTTLLNCEEKKKQEEEEEGGERNTSAHAEVLHTARLSYLPWGSPGPLSWHSNRSSTPASPSKYRAQIVVERITMSFKVIRNNYEQPLWPFCSECRCVGAAPLHRSAGDCLTLIKMGSYHISTLGY